MPRCSPGSLLRLALLACILLPFSCQAKLSKSAREKLQLRLREESGDTGAANKTKWRNGVPPSYWVWGRYICEVCKKDCGYANNLGLHRKRTHGLHYRQERLGYNGEIVRGTRINQTPAQPKPLKRKREVEVEAGGDTSLVTPVVKKFMSKAMPCFECQACKNPDCMKCKWCHDNKKYGGLGKFQGKRCITRRCTKL